MRYLKRSNSGLLEDWVTMNERFLTKRWCQNARVFLFQILLGAFVLCVHTSWMCRLVAEDTKSSAEYFGIQVVDSQTQRGVPLVQLKTVNGLTYVTDERRMGCLNEPGLKRHRGQTPVMTDITMCSLPFRSRSFR